MRIIFLVAVFTFINFLSYSQNIEGVLQKSDTYSAAHAQEKIYLHLDKYSYAAGETIWFKSYTTIGVHNLFSGLSGIAYVELINPSNKIVNSLTIPLLMGVGLGDIALSDTITEGSYRLRAYTNWMRNEGESYFYDRTIQIANGRSDNVTTSTSVETVGSENVYSIALKTLSGVSLGRIKVNYEVVHDGKSVSKKKVDSDEMGVVKIPVSDKYPNGVINLKFTNIDQKSVNKQIKLFTKNEQASVSLLPEGGKLISERINNLGIKSVNNKGKGIKAKVVFISNKDTVGLSETNHLGMGAVNLFLADTTALKVTAFFEDGTQKDIIFPKIETSGYSLIVNNNHKEKAYAQITASQDLIDNSELYFVVHHLGEVMFVSKQKVNKEEFVFVLDKKNLPNGVITLSILNNKFLPIAERPIFNYNERNVLKGEIQLNKPDFKIREKVEVELMVGTAADSLRLGAFSASVVYLSKIKDDYAVAPNIVSSLLLSSDLKGYIESPGFYFGEEVKTLDLDFLMLTQGWRNIDWKMLDASEKAVYEVEKSLKISGYTKKLGRSKPEPNAKVQLLSTKNFMDFIDTTSNEEGYFEFDKLLFPDSVKFLISAKTGDKGKNNIDITFNAKTPAEILQNKNEAEVIWDVNKEYSSQTLALKQYFSELEGKGLKEKAVEIEEVVVTRERPKAAPNSSNLNGSGNADQIITAEDLSTCPTLEMCLAGRLMGVTWQNGVPYNTRGNVEMQVVLDGMFIESDQISMINTTDVESVEVLRNSNYTAIYGMNGGNGLIIITSKTGLSAMNSRSFSPKGLLSIQPQGIYVNKTFYKPEYDVEGGLKFNNDVRTTIHWEPSIVTSKEGKAKFEFFTSDEKGKYLLTIEGIDLNGKILHKQMNINVN